MPGTWRDYSRAVLVASNNVLMSCSFAFGKSSLRWLALYAECGLLQQLFSEIGGLRYFSVPFILLLQRALMATITHLRFVLLHLTLGPFGTRIASTGQIYKTWCAFNGFPRSRAWAVLALSSNASAPSAPATAQNVCLRNLGGSTEAR